MSTISEYVQAHRIRELLAGRSGFLEPLPLVCGNGTRIVVDAGSLVPGSFPAADAGPWTTFAVSELATDRPGRIAPSRSVPAGDLVRLLERLGWPEAQLGKRWKKRSGHVPAGR